jgi:hypothetical protein
MVPKGAKMNVIRSARERLHLGLAPQLIGLIVVVALVAGGVFGTILTNTSRDALRATILHSNLAHANLATEFASAYIQAVQANARLFATRPTVVRAVPADTPEPVESELVQFMQIQSALDSAFIYDARGISRVTGAASKQAIGTSFADREWYEQVKL